MNGIRKITEFEILKRLSSGEVDFRPLTMEQLTPEPLPGVDARVRLRWQDRIYDFAVEVKSSATPRLMKLAILQAEEAGQRTDLPPMLIVPYLTEEKLRELETQRISAVDLSGNAVIVVPGQLFIYRSGASNRFPSSTPIREVYARGSSLVARTLLVRPRFDAVNDLYREILRRGGKIALSTVSKALKVMEEDLIVEREGRAFRLIQPDKLLDRLAHGYVDPAIRREIELRVPGERDALVEMLVGVSRHENLPMVLTGPSSAPFYGVIAGSDPLSFYTPFVEPYLGALPSSKETSRFPNLRLLTTDAPWPYYDIRWVNGYPVASPIQCYAELLKGDKRDIETAEQVRDAILRELKERSA